MLFGIAAYIRFLLESTNQYGLHSPFVYGLVTRCLYRKPRMDRNRTLDVLLKCQKYFEAKNIRIGNRVSLRQRMLKVDSTIRFDKDPLDLLLFERLDVSEFNTLLSKGRLHNDSMILIDGIRSNPQKLQLWNSLIALPQISVSMDLYHCGILFIRREQQKEHFKVRI